VRTGTFVPSGFAGSPIATVTRSFCPLPELGSSVFHWSLGFCGTSPDGAEAGR